MGRQSLDLVAKARVELSWQAELSALGVSVILVMMTSEIGPALK